MASSRSNFSGQLRQWLDRRAHEFSHCNECGGPASPLDKVCRECGQSSPCRVAPSVGICLALATVTLAAFGILLVQVF